MKDYEGLMNHQIFIIMYEIENHFLILLREDNFCYFLNDIEYLKNNDI